MTADRGPKQAVREYRPIPDGTTPETWRWNGDALLSSATLTSDDGPEDPKYILDFQPHSRHVAVLLSESQLEVIQEALQSGILNITDLIVQNSSYGPTIQDNGVAMSRLRTLRYLIDSTVNYLDLHENSEDVVTRLLLEEAAKDGERDADS